jgi:hypothetical protein
VRARNSVSYLTARRFSAQDRVNAIRAIKRLKADAGERETSLAAAEIALRWLRVSGNPGGWTVTNIAAGHSGENSFGARLAAAVAERLDLSYLQVWSGATGRSGASLTRRNSGACRRSTCWRSRSAQPSSSMTWRPPAGTWKRR